MTKHTKRLERIAVATGFSKEFIEEAAEYSAAKAVTESAKVKYRNRY